MTEPATTQTTKTLPRELSEFLLQFSIALHRYGIYPPGHPALDRLTSSLVDRLHLLFVDRSRLSIGVAHTQLLIDGTATDPANPVLRDLARRLYTHQIGALSFWSDIEVESFDRFLTLIAVNPEISRAPEGLRTEDERGPLSGILIHATGYDLLAVDRDGTSTDGEGAARAARLWLGLARAAVQSERPGDLVGTRGGGGRGDGSGEGTGAGKVAGRSSDDPPDLPSLTGADIVKSIARHDQEEAYEEVIVGYLLQIAEELRRSTGAEADTVRRRMSELIRELDDGALERILRMGGDTTRRQRFVLDANQTLTLDAVLKLLRAASQGTERTLSHSLTRMMTKLALHAEKGSAQTRKRSAAAFREMVDELVGSWHEDDPTSAEYAVLLDTMARAAPLLPPTGESEGAAEMEGSDGAFRIVQTALEAEGDGPVVTRAIETLTARGRVLDVLKLTDEAPSESEIAKRLVSELASPELLAELVERADIEDAAIRELARRIGAPAVPSLLAVLENSESRSVRRRAFDALVAIGDGLAPHVPKLISDPRWFVRRNVLALLHASGSTPDDFTPIPFLRDPDPRVRRASLQLAASLSSFRAEALLVALADSDERVVHAALIELQADLPDSVLPTLLARIIRGDNHPALRTLAIRALRDHPSEHALRAVLELLDGGRFLFFFGPRRLRPPSAEVREALHVVLGPRWRDHARVAWVHRAGGRSWNAELRAWIEEATAS